MKPMKTYFFNLRKFTAFSLAALSSLVIVNIISSGAFINFFQKLYMAYFNDKTALFTVIPLLSSEKDKTYDGVIKVVSAFVMIDIENPVEIIKENFTAIVVKPQPEKTEPVPQKNVPEKTVSEESPPVAQTTVNPVNQNGGVLEQMGVTVKNETSYQVDVNALYNEPLKITKRTDAPQILLIHTHGSEAFNPTARNVDTNNNIVRVGREMKSVFEQNGISVIHSEIMHDIPKYNNSYGKALETITQVLNENPSINIVLDVHRDAITKEDGTPVKVSADVNNQETAQVMFVVGTNESGLSHDNWRENLKLAIKCQQAINSVYPKLARPINLRTERFNQHKSYGSLILEVGTHGNSLEEAILAGKYSAQAISNVINSLN